MGLAMVMELQRAPLLAEARILRPLAAFGFLHGIHEWYEAFLLHSELTEASFPPWAEWISLALLVSSYLVLFLFALEALKLVPHPLPRLLRITRSVLGLYFISFLIGLVISYPESGIQHHMLEGLTRYIVAIPSSLLAALGLHYVGRDARARSPRLERAMNSTAYGFGLYGITHLIVEPLPIFPGNILNADTFQSLFKFPIEILWMIATIWITIALIAASREADRVRQAQLFAAQQAQVTALEKQQEARKNLLEYIIRAREDERTRIARELHDDTAQTLAAFSFQLASLRNSLPPGSDPFQMAEQLLALNQHAAQEIYTIITDLRPTHLDELGLVSAIRFLADRYQSAQGFDFQVLVNGPVRRLKPNIETMLFRVTQEALANTVRHAGDKVGTVELNYNPDRILLRVQDRGKGFDPMEEFVPPRGLGLAGIRERVEAVGGSLRIESSASRGTTIEITIPTPKEEPS
jgi:signal transduction histidine kinase